MLLDHGAGLDKNPRGSHPLFLSSETMKSFRSYVNLLQHFVVDIAADKPTTADDEKRKDGELIFFNVCMFRGPSSWYLQRLELPIQWRKRVLAADPIISRNGLAAGCWCMGHSLWGISTAHLAFYILIFLDFSIFSLCFLMGNLADQLVRYV
jgi:hypothetical protein